MRPSRLLAATVGGAVAAAIAVPAFAAPPDTVTISGNAYAFIFAGNNDRLPGAVISVDQIPGLSVTAGDNGAYSIEVPDDRDITLHAVAAGYHETYTQTFHTSGADLTQVNFQMPANPIFAAMAQYAGAQLDDQGNLVDCAIVTTAYQLKGRGYSNFDDFHEFHPHGVAGSLATNAGPAAPMYFNSSVLPDPNQAGTSSDGGIVWKGVPEGRHTLSATNPTHRLASFVADCKPGRFVNASPPWGFYELAANETTNEAALVAPTVSVQTPASARYGAALAATVTVTGPGDGVVVLEEGGSPVAAGDLAGGHATISLAGLGIGTHQLVGRYLASGRTSWTVGTPVTVEVRKAVSATRLSAPKKAARKHAVSVRIRVSATGVTPTGAVALYDGAKRLRTLKLTGGTAIAKVSLGKAGMHRLRAVYAGSPVAEGSSSAIARVRVR